MITKRNFVYLIGTNVEGSVKLGRSTDPFDRLAKLQTANREPLRIILFTEGDSQMEAWLKRFFAKFKAPGGDEWFDITASEFIDAIEKYRLQGRRQMILPFIQTKPRQRTG